MPTARVVLYLALIVVNVTAIAAWLWYARRRRLRDRPLAADMAIGFVANFLDTLGIGSYAQITALFKMRGRPADELIPGTLNVGGIVPSFVGCWLFVVAITVEPVLLTCMVVSAAAGAWIGADIVSRSSSLPSFSCLQTLAFRCRPVLLWVSPAGASASRSHPISCWER
jgi:uncharacterized membrane protein YfcA